MRVFSKVVVLLSVFALACGASEEGSAESSSEQASTGGETHEASAEGPSLADMAWHDVPADQRGQYMAEVVVPAMKPLFEALDAERYADFGCATCHGTNAAEVHFQMPNGLAPLDPSSIGAMYQSEQPMAQLMTQQVHPRMVELLGEPAYDSATGEGFGCLGCHATAE